MRMIPGRIVPARILAGIEEQSHNVCVSMLGGEREGDVPASAIGEREKPSRCLEPAQSRRRG